MKQNKIYLSLDDLNKLYGISPSILKAIKKKQKKRKYKRLKRNKINNNNMNNNKSSSDHMVISSNNLLSTETQRLNVANVQKHIDDINKNNRLLVENNIPKDNNYNQLNEIMEGVKTGKYQLNQLNNGLQLKNKALNKKPGPKKKSKQVEELDVEEIYSPNISNRFEFLNSANPVIVRNPLTNANTNLMNRNQSNVIAEDLDDGNGNIPSGTNSDNFIVSDGTDIQPDIPIDNQDNQDNQPEPEQKPEQEKIGIETVNIQKDEPKASIETVEKKEEKVKKKTYRDYTKADLYKIAKKNNITSTYTHKVDLYDYLKEKQII